jgi:hypothetical protein
MNTITGKKVILLGTNAKIKQPFKPVLHVDLGYPRITSIVTK